jgi:hypothetical protein
MRNGSGNDVLTGIRVQASWCRGGRLLCSRFEFEEVSV